MRAILLKLDYLAWGDNSADIYRYWQDFILNRQVRLLEGALYSALSLNSVFTQYIEAWVVWLQNSCLHILRCLYIVGQSFQISNRVCVYFIEFILFFLVFIFILLHFLVFVFNFTLLNTGFFIMFSSFLSFVLSFFFYSIFNLYYLIFFRSC